MRPMYVNVKKWNLKKIVNNNQKAIYMIISKQDNCNGSATNVLTLKNA